MVGCPTAASIWIVLENANKLLTILKNKVNTLKAWAKLNTLKKI